MADSKITALTAISTVDPTADPLVIVDVSDTSMAASGTTKKSTINQLLGAGGTATLASATISGDLTVDTNTLKVDSANNRVGIVQATPLYPLDVTGTVNGTAVAARLGYGVGGSVYSAFRFENTSFSGGNSEIRNYVNGATGTGSDLAFFTTQTGGSTLTERYRLDVSGVATWSNVGGVAGTAMTLNANGLGVGRSPSYRLQASSGTKATNASIATVAGITTTDADDFGIYFRLKTDATGANRYAAITSFDNGSGNGARDLVLQDLGGNVGIGVTPSAWNSSAKAFEIGTTGNSVFSSGATFVEMTNNAYLDSVSNWVRVNTGNAAARFRTSGSGFLWLQAAAGANPITWTQAMTLDASGNLLVGTTSAVGKFNLTQTANANAVCVNGNVGNFLNFYGWSADSTWNANSTAIFVGKNTSTSRSINAGGTVNASGADYAEYMTKAGDFVLSKGGIAGIDANGKLTNVFADAVSFVVKSTDPSYVGNDKWGIGLEGDALEAARQLVDRIAFAGQVPVNVTGAKAGDYIVPVVDGTGIKGIAVSNPTFEQYQLAVGKVIAIDSDGRARIIVKVA